MDDEQDSKTQDRATAGGGGQVHHGSPRGIRKDEQLKQLLRQHPQRDEPRVDSVEPDDLPRS